MITATRPETKSVALKGDLFSISVIEITQPNLDHFSKDLQVLIKEAPNFFNHTPIVLDLHKLTTLNKTLSEIVICLKEKKFIVVGIRGGNEHFKKQALAQGIPILSKFRSQEPTLATRQMSVETKPIIKPKATQSKIIETPIRSGQQYYAAEGDLIILSSVSEGAEVLASGNIHIYGTLRGRALAGVEGNQAARLFVSKLEAELISIAGVYTTAATQLKSNEARQILLSEGKLIFNQL